MIKKLGFAALLMLTASVASAGETCERFLIWCIPTIHQSPIPVKAPELDLSSSLAALALIVGGLAVLHGRRSTRSVK